MIRKIVEINEKLCNGCGACASACQEGAIEMVEGKARLMRDDYCDGLGNCLPACPANAITIIEREADDFDEVAVMQKQKSVSELSQWPIQIKLVPVTAPYFHQADLLIAADCTAFSYARFHQDFIKNHITLIGCPKLDEGNYADKLALIIKNNEINSIKIVKMEVPCCKGLEYATIQAMKQSHEVTCEVITITCDGQIQSEERLN